MLGFIEKCIFTGLAFLSTLTSIDSLNCISMINQECRIRPQIVNVNGDDPLFFPFSIKTREYIFPKSQLTTRNSHPETHKL